MKNADVIEGQAYCFSEREPSIQQKGTKVVALGFDKVPERGRQVTMVRVRYETPRTSWTGRTVAEAGTEGHVPARQLWGPYEERAARADDYLNRRAEADRLKEEIAASLVALGLVSAETPRVFGRVGGASLGIEVTVYGAEECQRLSDALSFAASGGVEMIRPASRG